jgi:hypothetical protein
MTQPTSTDHAGRENNYILSAIHDPIVCTHMPLVARSCRYDVISREGMVRR